jgi:hypothetical protein
MRIFYYIKPAKMRISFTNMMISVAQWGYDGNVGHPTVCLGK